MCACVNECVCVPASQLDDLCERQQLAGLVNTGIAKACEAKAEARACEVTAQGLWQATVFNKLLPSLGCMEKQARGLSRKNAVSQIAVQRFRQPPSNSPSSQG